jgi:BirA family biotin operon repressor/biotin-[acetyl-CoA-carboxylase] ligase
MDAAKVSMGLQKSRTKLDLPRLISSGQVQRLEYHDSVASTNDRAALLAEEPNLACPALVAAREQTAGRGRGSNRWWSAPGGLMFSLVLERPTTASGGAHWSGYSLTAGLAICEALSSQLPSGNFSVKWPNDVYAGEQKICGILIESPAQARGRLIVGVGVNINNSFGAAPQDLRRSATSLCDVAGETFDLTEVLICILRHLDNRWLELVTLGFAALRDAWRERSLLTGRAVQLRVGAEMLTGRCLGIDDDGALLLQTEQGRHTCHAGSVVAFE